MTGIDPVAAKKKSPTTDIRILAGFSLTLFLFHILTGALSSYGYFIDELYYIACSRHLAFGYVDHPPLSILLLALSRWSFGDSLPWLRVFPALSAAGTVFMTGLTVRLLGGSRAAIITADVAGVYHSLPEEEQRNTVIVSTNYGEAGALELYGAEFRLPRVYATHNSYFLWGPPPDSIRIYIAVFVDRNDLANRFESVVEAALHTCDDCTRPQRSIPIYVARGPRFSITKEWVNFRTYD